MKLEYYRQIFEKSSNIKFYETPVGAEVFHADGRRDGRRDEAIVAFRNFAKGPKIAPTFMWFCVPFTSIWTRAAREDSTVKIVALCQKL